MATVAVITGCDKSTQFAADDLRLVDRQVEPAHREQIFAALSEQFGTPDEPRVPEAVSFVLREELLAQAAGPVESHTPGVTQGLYRRHCARCHGLTGDGRGPTALYQAPYPRDFRAGVFKFKSTARGLAPTDDDLHATLERGVPGTAMPSFRLLKQEERDALVAYVKYLAIRGKTEERLVELVADELEPEEEIPGEFVDESVAMAASSWQIPLREFGSQAPSAEQLAEPDRIAAGRAIFHDERRANCAKCHGVGGVGDVGLKDFDDWDKRRYDFAGATERKAASLETMRERMLEAEGDRRTRLAKLIAEEEASVAERRAVVAAMFPPRDADPRQIAGGALRGRAEPEQLFRVIHEGIAGTPMPAAGSALSEDEVWSVVAYVRSLLAAPSPEMVVGE